MPTFTSTAVRTRTGTEIHAAPEGFSRTYCGCRVYSRLSRADLMAAQAAGQLCDKCWRGAAQTETPAEWQARCDRVDAEYLAAEAAELDAETAEGKCPTCGHAAHGANSWCMAGTEAPRFAGERAAELEAPAAESLTHRAYRLIDELDEACADCADLKIRNAGLADLDAARAYYHQCAYGHAVKRAAHGLGRFIVPVPCEEPSEYQTGVVEVDGRDVGEGLSRFR